MSLQGPLLVVSEGPSGDLVEALGAAGAFPIIEAKWADAPTALVSVKPCAVIIADPGTPPSEANARMLCLQIATASGPIVPVLACTFGDFDAAVPIAIPCDIALPLEHTIARLRAALRVRTLHATVLRRIETYGSERGTLPDLPIGDPLESATVMVVGRGPIYPALSVAMGERVGMIGALSVETAAKHLNSRDIDGIVIADGFSQRMIEALLAVLAQDDRFRNIPAGVIGEVPRDLVALLPNVDQLPSSPARIVARMIAPVRLHALEARFKRMLKALETDGIFDSHTGLLTREGFWREMKKAVAESGQNGQALSIGRFSFEGELPVRVAQDSARLATRLTRDSDFACQEDDGAILIAFGHTDLRSAHIIARRIAATLRHTVMAPGQPPLDANVTLATFKGSDTLDSLMMRVNGGEVIAAE